MPAFVKIGVIGLGRMGLLYTRMLATQIAGARLHAVAEVDGRARSQVADDLAISHIFADPYGRAVYEVRGAREYAVATPAVAVKAVDLPAVEVRAGHLP